VSLITVSIRNAARPHVREDFIAGAQQPGAVAPHRWGPHSPPEDDLHLRWAADVEVVGAQRFKEPAGGLGCGEHDRAGDLDLARGDVPPVARGPIRVGQRQWQPRPPAFTEHPDRSGIRSNPAGSSVVAKPLSSCVNPMPAAVAARFEYS
jgi:hypothetical protein